MFTKVGVIASTHSYRGLLDSYSEVTAAFSLRRLKSSQAKCIRVRRSSDSAEQDIYFNAKGELDQTDLLAFVGANDGHVAVWYDQSGNSLDANQVGTPGFQPKIVEAGVVNTLNGKPTVKFDTASFNFMDVANSSLYTAVGGEWQAFGVGNFGDTTNPYSWWDADWQASMRLGQFLRSNGITLAAVAFNTLGTAFGVTNVNLSTTSQVLLSTMRTATAIQICLNNTVGSPVATTGTPMTGTTVKVAIGASNGGGIQRLLGSIQEIIHFGSAVDNRVPITTNINNYYNVF